MGLSNTSVKSPTCSPAVSNNCDKVAVSIKGTSPYNTNVRPYGGICGKTIFTACPVPNCSVCSTQVMLVLWASCAKTCSLPCPITTLMLLGLSVSATLITCSSMDLPAIWCNTLGILEYIRVPLPAAKIIIFNDIIFPCLIKNIFQAA